MVKLRLSWHLMSMLYLHHVGYAQGNLQDYCGETLAKHTMIADVYVSETR